MENYNIAYSNYISKMNFIFRSQHDISEKQNFDSLRENVCHASETSSESEFSTESMKAMTCESHLACSLALNRLGCALLLGIGLGTTELVVRD